MPELPEVEFIVRRLREFTSGRIIRRVEVLRPSMVRPQSLDDFEHSLNNRTITGFERRAKNVLIHLKGGDTIRVRLGMTGHVFFLEDPRHAPTHTRIVFHLRGGGAIIFEDPRTFGSVATVKTTELEALLSSYGPEPLDAAFTPAVFRDAAKGLRLPVKQFLLDQKRVSGLGNIWAVEALWRARIHPQTPLDRLSTARLNQLHAGIKAALEDAVKQGLKVAGGPDDFPDVERLKVAVYGREGQPCRRCKRPIAKIAQAGRSTFFCPFCQKKI
jgi:formamidopyrimidine-DNA glycosylase